MAFPGSSSYHPFRTMGFSLINQPAIKGYPHGQLPNFRSSAPRRGFRRSFCPMWWPTIAPLPPATGTFSPVKGWCFFGSPPDVRWRLGSWGKHAQTMWEKSGNHQGKYEENIKKNGISWRSPWILQGTGATMWVPKPLVDWKQFNAVSCFFFLKTPGKHCPAQWFFRV